MELFGCQYMMVLQDLVLLVHVPIPSAPSLDDPSAEVERYNMKEWLHKSLCAYLRNCSALCVSECSGTHDRIIIMPMFPFCA